VIFDNRVFAFTVANRGTEMRHGSLIATLFWLLPLFGGMAYWAAYDSRAGSPGHVAEARPTPLTELVLFVHPKCPCARGGIAALAGMDAGACQIRIVFVGPAEADADWWTGRNWEDAAGIADAAVERDSGGAIAWAYGVRTSGHAVVYSADGRLLFSGGLAPSRNAALAQSRPPFDLKAILAEPGETLIRRPVLGCPLFDGE